MPMRCRILAAVVGAALVGGCDNPSAPALFAPSVSVRFSGALKGQFSITAPTDDGDEEHVWSEAYWADSTGFNTYGTRPTANARIDWVTIAAPVKPGVYVMDPRCESICAHVSMGVQAPASSWGSSEGASSWILERGTITIRPPDSDGRVRGAFSGSGQLHQTVNGRQRDLGDVTVSGAFETGLLLPHRAN